MRDENAAQILSKIMDWKESDDALNSPLEALQRLAEFKYDHYQRFAPGRRFIESLALWLDQFELDHRGIALKFVSEQLIFISNKELSHLVETAYFDIISQQRIRLVAEELGIATFKVAQLVGHPRYRELGYKSLYLGLSDGARTNDLRRASLGEIGNEQIWQAYELSDEKINDMTEALGKSLALQTIPYKEPRFNHVWLVDDFSASGNTYIRYDSKNKKFKGKIKKIYEKLSKGNLIDRSHYEVYLLLYVATTQALDHIEYWAERFTNENGFKPLQVIVVQLLDPGIQLSPNSNNEITDWIGLDSNYDPTVFNEHMEVGKTADVRWGFASCGLPVVLEHNTPNNSLYLLWAYETCNPRGLFPRVSRHKEF